MFEVRCAVRTTFNHFDGISVAAGRSRILINRLMSPCRELHRSLDLQNLHLTRAIFAGPQTAGHV
jgi:hypothetical protein